MNDEANADTKNECPICLEVLSLSCVLPCKHEICFECVSNKKIKDCPLCRLPVDLESKTDSQYQLHYFSYVKVCPGCQLNVDLTVWSKCPSCETETTWTNRLEVLSVSKLVPLSDSDSMVLLYLTKPINCNCCYQDFATRIILKKTSQDETFSSIYHVFPIDYIETEESFPFIPKTCLSKCVCCLQN